MSQKLRSLLPFILHLIAGIILSEFSISSIAKRSQSIESFILLFKAATYNPNPFLILSIANSIVASESTAMAETIPIDKLSLSPEQRDSDKLMRHLQEHHNMPLEAWWTSVDTAFQHLQSLLNILPKEASDEEDDPESISAQAARADALPLVSLLPSGSHAMRLTATNEDLQCVAFGTVSDELYVDIFWEAVNIYRDEDGSFVVNKIESGFWFNFDGHNFHLLYVRCENVVRACPGILDVPDEIVQGADTHTQRLVGAIKRDTQSRAHFTKPHQRASYYYLRAWMIARGRYTPNHRLTSSRTLTFQQLIKIMDPQELLDIKTERAALHPKPQNKENPMFSMSYDISDIFQKLKEKVLSLRPYPQTLQRVDPERGPAELLKVLHETEVRGVHSNLQTPLYIKVNAPSSFAHWLLY